MKNIFKDQLPKIKTAIPGPESKRLAQDLQKYECPNLTFTSKDTPIFWGKALGANVWDVDGNRYIDMVAAFGVASVGHAHPKVVNALTRQAHLLPHAMGDVYPSPEKVQLAKVLSDLFPEKGAQVFFGSSGAEAVEIAMKTAHLATGKSGLIVFEGAYHGLTYGALRATSMLDFGKPFINLKLQNVFRLPHPSCFPEEKILTQIKKILRSKNKVGAILIEPIQGRGGVRVTPHSFLRSLRKICNQTKTLLIVDEIYSGFGRTGKWFAFQHSKIVPDLVTVGKGMANGFPISACIGRKKVMAAWPRSHGEALHTSTFLGNPLGCAMALASVQEIQSQKLLERAARLGALFKSQLLALKEKHPCIGEIRGQGLMLGIEIISKREKHSPNPKIAQEVVFQALKQGIILLADGVEKNILMLTPPLIISEQQFTHSLKVIDQCLSHLKN